MLQLHLMRYFLRICIRLTYARLDDNFKYTDDINRKHSVAFKMQPTSPRRRNGLVHYYVVAREKVYLRWVSRNRRLADIVSGLRGAEPISARRRPLDGQLGLSGALSVAPTYAASAIPTADVL